MIKIWLNDLNNEKNFHNKFQELDVSRNAQANASNRWVCLNWIREVAFQRGVNRRTFHSTVKLMEYLLLECSPNSDFQLLVVSAFLVASKVNVIII